MSELELIELCKDSERKKGLHWSAEIYGFSPLIKRYGYFPKSWALNVFFSHGVTTFETPAPYELKNNAPAMLYFSPRMVAAFRKVSSKPCFCLISPNVFYRRKNGIVQSQSAKGTLAFYAHSTPVIDNISSIESYVSDLKTLSEEYQPVAVCLHYHDISKGVHKEFIQRGFDVFTAGNIYDTRFIPRFYSILKNFKYTTSNLIGSYAFYSIEMGIPFFLHGQEVEFFNRGDKYVELGSFTSFKSTNQYKIASQHFGRKQKDVTREQRLFVEQELGVYDSISRFRCSIILYRAWISYSFRKLKSLIKTELKSRSKNGVLE